MPRDDDWLSISEAAEALDVSVSTLRAWSASGRIPCARTRGGHRRFSRPELRRWMADGSEPRGGHMATLAVPRSPAAADALAGAAGDIAGLTDAFLAEAAHLGTDAANAAARRQAAASWVRTIADGLRAGDLRVPRDRAIAHGWAMRDAGVAADGATRGLMALERAVDAAIADRPEIDPADAARIVTAVQWLACAAMEAWATPPGDRR